MLNLFEQIVLLFALIVGIISGEFISSRVFGRSGKFLMVLIELLFFVVILVTLGDSVTLQQGQLGKGIAVNFIIGLIATVASIGIVTALGYLGKLPEVVLQGHTKEEKLLINSMEALFSKGFSEKEVIETMKKAGFKEKEAKLFIKVHGMKPSPNPLIEKVIGAGSKK